MTDRTMGLPREQVVGPKQDRRKTRLERYAETCKRARWWVESLGEAWAASDSDEFVRLMNFQPEVLEDLEEALNPEQETEA